MAHDQAVVFRRTIATSATQASTLGDFGPFGPGYYGPFETHLARDLAVSGSIDAGDYQAFLEGAIGDEWGVLKQKFSVTTLVLSGANKFYGVAEIVPRVRWHVTSIASGSTLTLNLYGMGVQ